VLDRYFGPRFAEEPTNLDIWDRIDRISDDELWRTHERRRERLVVFARDRLKKEMRRMGVSEKGLARADDALSPSALTISFARRFATYKRGNLLLSDPDRLLRLLSDKDRPLQIIFAGKAHPHDMPGKEIIKELVHFSRRIVFLEDYDMTMARYMTSGSDVWLNTPRRPLEASGTSGMKAGMNGVLNCSVLDGWWAEGYTPECGWAIGKGEEYADTELQDEIESKALYDLLEREILPTFYERGRDGLPRDWIKMMKASIHDVGKRFSFHRTLMEYTDRYYLPALANARELGSGGYERAKAVADYLDAARREWANVAIEDVRSTAKPVMERGDKVRVEARVRIGALRPEQVLVELYHGPVSSTGDIYDPARAEMKAGKSQGGAYEYSVEVACESTGQHGYSVRVLPCHEGLVHPFIPGLVRWA
jgi:starch phosphorylase